MEKIAIKLVVLVLAGLGVWLLYERYGKRVEGPAQHFADRAVSAVEDAGRTIERAGNQATDAVGTAAGRIADAAKLAGHDVATEFSE